MAGDYNVSGTRRVDQQLPKRCRLVPLDVRGDERGSLVAIESASGLPFTIARVYYIFDTKPGVSRGFHAHRSLRQWAICLAGSCNLVLDDGVTRTELRLDRPDLAVEIGPMIWREMHDFTSDCVMMVLAAAEYEERDYIRDRAEFDLLVDDG